MSRYGVRIVAKYVQGIVRYGEKQNLLMISMRERKDDMKKIEDDCVGPCPQGCMGAGCPNKRIPHYYCDECKEEFGPGELREYDDGRQLCESCLLDEFPVVE